MRTPDVRMEINRENIHSSTSACIGENRKIYPLYRCDRGRKPLYPPEEQERLPVYAVRARATACSRGVSSAPFRGGSGLRIELVHDGLFRPWARSSVRRRTSNPCWIYVAVVVSRPRTGGGELAGAPRTAVEVADLPGAIGVTQIDHRDAALDQGITSGNRNERTIVRHTVLGFGLAPRQ